MFFDLNVAWDSRREAAIAELATRFGYAGVAFSVTMSGSQLNNLATHTCPIAPSARGGPGAERAAGPLHGALAASLGRRAEGPLLRLRRLNLVVTDSAQVAAVAQTMQRVRPAYDLITVRPTTAEAWHAVSSGRDGLDCDVVTLPLDEKLPFPIKRKDCDAFLRRGGFFEVEFAPALRDPGRRRLLISNVAQLVHATRGRHVLVSSAAADPMEMRSPHDLANFAAVLGLRGALSLESVSDVPYRALQKAALRGGCAQVSPAPPLAPAAAAPPPRTAASATKRKVPDAAGFEDVEMV